MLDASSRQAKQWPRTALRLVGVLLCAYLAVLLWLYWTQDQLIFHPATRGVLTPKNFGVSEYQELRIEVRSGESISAWWVKDGSGPLLLYCHGNGANLSALAKVVPIFVALGVRPLLFEYRGYGLSSNPTEGLSQESMRQDAMAAYAWLRAQDPAAPTLVWGHSLGAAVASQLASEMQPPGLILEGSFSSIADMSAYRYPYLVVPSFLLRNTFETESYVARYRGELLVLHALQDEIIPYKFGQKVFAAAPSEKAFITLDEIGHNDFPAVWRQYADPIRAFIARVQAAPSAEN